MAVGQLALLLAVLAVLPQESFECASNGLCGPACGARPPPAPCGCQQQGYQCGSYGCYRHRVRGSKSFQPKRSRSRVHSSSVESSIEKDREVLRESIVPINAGESQPVPIFSDGSLLGMDQPHQSHRHHMPRNSDEALEMVSPTVAETNRREGPVDPNKAFMECCMDRQLPDACLSKCNFGAYNKQALTAMYFKQDPCPLEAMKEMQFCAAQGRDHTECCARNGVTTTLAGAKCLMFCDQRLGRETRLDMSYVPCFDRFESMKACFWHDLTKYYKA